MALINTDEADMKTAEEKPDYERRDQLEAAAQDMLDALELVVGSLKFDREDPTSREVLRRVNAAISKARGEA